MFKKSFGSKGQISFNNENEYYQALGYLAKSDNTTSIHWEKNEEQGAWGNEGRIHFYTSNPQIPGEFKLTAGVGNILHRTNCNEFIKNIVNNHNFQYEYPQDSVSIKSTISDEYKDDFDIGLNI